jgi:hypothetical protein
MKASTPSQQQSPVKPRKGLTKIKRDYLRQREKDRTELSPRFYG